jgi:hypothetical protein
VARLACVNGSRWPNAPNDPLVVVGEDGKDRLGQLGRFFCACSVARFRRVESDEYVFSNPPKE